MASSPELSTLNCSAFDSNTTLNFTLPPLDYSLADTYKVVAGSLVFLFILPFVLFEFSFFPIGASSAILLGAVLMVATTVLNQRDFYEIIGEDGNLRTIFLLLGMMIISQYFEREHIIHKMMNKMLKNDISFPGYLWRVNMLSFIVAALFTNDAACIILTPLVLRHWCSQNRPTVELETLTLAISTSANIGSVITIFGNPQMALIASTTEEPVFLKSQLDLQRSITYLGIPAVIGYFLNLAFLVAHFQLNASYRLCNKPVALAVEVDAASSSEADVKGRSRIFLWLPLLVLIVMLVLFFVKTDDFQFDIGILPMAASALIMTADAVLNKTNPSRLIMKVDWNVILMFFGIFVWLGGVNATRVPRYVWEAIGLAGHPINDAKTIATFSAFVIFGSNIFSNVPLTIIVLEQLQPCADQLELVLYLAWCSTIAGNLTLFGSVANIIVAQKSKQTLNIPLTFWTFFKYGFLTTLIITVQGIFIIYGLLRL
ncbi:uncharacterized protein [Haliotis cracherodii]|uniref:uncharacterized protein n=1 Tax=Haliotis cracherodii TaxID=6455 RepID=UPI0039E9C94B